VSNPLKWKSIILLLATTFFWGLTFVYVKEGTAVIGVYSFLSLRFFIAAAVLQLLFIRRRRPLRADTVKEGIKLGLLLTLSYVLQTEGLQSSSVVNSAFITGLFVVFVPFMSPFFSSQKPLPLHILAAAMSLAGLLFMTGVDPETFVIGDLLILGCAVSFALYVVLVGNMKAGHDSIQLTVIQLYVVAGITFLVETAAHGTLRIPPDWDIWYTVLFCALFATSFSYSVEIHYQRNLTDTQAALIYSMEPVFAAAAAWFMLGEVFSSPMIIGSIMIMTSMFISATHTKGHSS